MLTSHPFKQLTKHEARVLRDRFKSCGTQPRPEDEATIDRLLAWLEQAAR